MYFLSQVKFFEKNNFLRLCSDSGKNIIKQYTQNKCSQNK